MRLATSANLSVGSGLGQINILAGVTYFVKVKAVDVNGYDQTIGGDDFVITVENLCTVKETYLCEQSASSNNLSNLPIFKKMIDHGDGTYTSDFLLS